MLRGTVTRLQLATDSSFISLLISDLQFSNALIVPMGFPKYERVLQNGFSLTDSKWEYRLSDLPTPHLSNETGKIKACRLIANADSQKLILTWEPTDANRAISGQPLDWFVRFTCSDFKLLLAGEQPASREERLSYLTRFLKTGLVLNGVHYHFYGHSNSQLKGRSCFLMAGSRTQVADAAEKLGDFSKITSVAKKVNRIGLLFSSASAVMSVQPGRCRDIPDIENDYYNFTDGCGLISANLAQILVRKSPIIFKNQHYLPSVFQIRYRGYKGVVTLEPRMTPGIWLELRKSMHKFGGTDNMEFAVINNSKPYAYAYLNDELILLLHALGIDTEVLLRKQADYFTFLDDAANGSRFAFRLLTSLGRYELAEDLVIRGAEEIQGSLNKILTAERKRLQKESGEHKSRILVPRSRFLFGVCDPRDVLLPGECFVRVTHDEDGIPRTITGGEVLVARNPCLHPGDLQKFRAVAKPELDHLRDCIVFPTRGRRPAADMMSGGDLDGDAFFVCWDPDLVPSAISEPAEYPAAREPLRTTGITYDDRIEYFASSSNAQLGRIKKLFLRWARQFGPLSSQCQELNRLFSQCVDANKVKIPDRLIEVPPEESTARLFVLDQLHEQARQFLQQKRFSISLDKYCSLDTLKAVLEEPHQLSQFELARLTLRWCQSNDVRFEKLWHYIDPTRLSSEERSWLLAQLPSRYDTPSLVMNDLVHSDILQLMDLQFFGLQNPRVRWRCVFKSSQDRIATLLDAVNHVFPTFGRKLLVIHISDRLSVAVYLHGTIPSSDECALKRSCRIFSFPHTQGNENASRRMVPVKHNSRLYYDQHLFQLYEGKRGNSFIFLVRPPSDDSNYRREQGRGRRARSREQTVESGVNNEWVTSIALVKFNQDLQEHVGRVWRQAILGAELYVISNTDTRSCHHLDLWLEQVDTDTVHQDFANSVSEEPDFPSIHETDWSRQPQLVVTILRDRKFGVLQNLSDWTQVRTLLDLTWKVSARDVAHQVYTSVLSSEFFKSASSDSQALLRAMVDFLDFMPELVVHFVKLCPWNNLAADIQRLFRDSAPKLAKALILCANKMQAMVIGYLQDILKGLLFLDIELLIQLTELIALVVSSPSVAFDILVEGLAYFTTISAPSVVVWNGSYVLKSLAGIVLDHIEGASDSDRADKQASQYQWKFVQETEYSKERLILKCDYRIDAPTSAKIAVGDHVRFNPVDEPPETIETGTGTFEALVQSHKSGQVVFQCLRRPPAWYRRCLWNMQSCGSFVTSKTMIEGLTRIASESEQHSQIIKSIFASDPDTLVLNELLNPPLEATHLNQSQQQAAQRALQGPLTCIWGPPGTGKTHTTVTICHEILVRDPEKRLLVTAPTHSAVDNVLRQYVQQHPEPLTPQHQPVRAATDVYRVSKDLQKYTCDAMVGADTNQNLPARRKAAKQIKNARFVFTTCVGARLGLLRNEKFDIVIIDEASQQTEPASLVPLSKGCSGAILVGDHVQLRATVRPYAQTQDFDMSLFERLWTGTGGNSSIRKVMLDTQYRMHPSICAFPSTEFYDGRLLTGETCHRIRLPKTRFEWPRDSRRVFIQTNTSEDLGLKSKGNAGQAQICREVLQQLQSRPDPVSTSASTSTSVSTPTSIAVLTPYTRQVELLKRLCPDATISTIDAFQGREADVIIYVTVRCNLHGDIGFLHDMRRLNVVLTRAKAGLIVIGDTQTLTLQKNSEQSCATWDRLIKSIKVVQWDARSNTKTASRR